MTRRIDHLVLAVHDLEAAAAFYDRLGFQVGARNHHPWGTDNHVIQFGSSFLELITVADSERVPPHTNREFSFGAFVQDHLSVREGLAMLALDSTDARADATAYAGAGIGDFEPFRFERSGTAADGSETHVAFSLAFALDDRLPDSCFFVCEQHYPEAFWSSSLQRHANGAIGVSAVTLDVDHPRDHTDFLEAYTGVRAEDDGCLYRLDRSGRLVVVPSPGGLGFSGFCIAVPELGAMAKHLTDRRIPFSGGPERIVLDSDQCFGSCIAFEEVRGRR